MNAFEIESLRHPGKLFIGGAWVEPSSAASIDVIDSASEDVFLTVAAAGVTDIDRAVLAAREAFDHGPWPMMTPQERAAYLEKIADALDRRVGAIADNWTAEVGIVSGVSRYISGTLSGVFRYYASLADGFVWEEEHISSEGLPALLVREPVGVVAAIVPWNAPGMLMTYKVAPALLAGCAIVVKASPEAPSAPYIFGEICEEVGLPAGVVNVIAAHREESESLVRNPGVDKVTFTGSTAAGRRIASICGDRIARCTLELGGKSPALILDDYDLDAAVQSIAGSAPIMNGQVCSSLTRIIVTQDRHDAFAEALGAAFGSVRVGDPFADDSQMGPMASAAHRDRVENYIAQGRSDGARLVTGGGRPTGLNRGYYVEPTVFAGVRNDLSIAQEEIFGPVLSIIPARDEAEAVEIANATIFGLNATIFTQDPERAYAVGRRIRSGTVGMNGFKSEFGIAFGGFKQSGIGREGGVEGLHPFLETKTMVFDTMPRTR